MAIVFYYAPMSSSVTVHWALEELGVPYEKVKVDIKAARDQDRPAFRAMNPNGKVPVLVHDGTPIFESVAIVIHLGETFGVDRGLFPPPGPRRAEALKWLVWCNVSLGEALSRYLCSTSEHVSPARHNAAEAAASKADVEGLLAILDGALAGRTWLVGDSFSLVDVHLSGWVEYVGMCGFDVRRPPHLGPWTKRCTSRPAFAHAFAP
jgi:glutathione S-transferase